MLSRFFQPAPVLDNDAIDFMRTVQTWALQSFGKGYFDQQVQLVLPTNEFFPERISNVEEMAAKLLQRMQHYAGLEHWPLQITDQPLDALALPAGLQPPQPTVTSAPAPTDAQLPPVRLQYNPRQASDPQAMIASHGQQLGACLMAVAPIPAPVDAEQLPLVAELLAVHMGFGIQLANSAFVFAGGCGSCGKRAGARPAYLNQDEALMALALFCQRKGIALREVTPHLKKHLRPVYKRAMHQLNTATS